MCAHNTLKEITIERRVWVDECIADTIGALNRKGVYTTGCCCGHGKELPTATILPSSAERARELGYAVVFNASGPYIVLEVPHER